MGRDDLVYGLDETLGVPVADVMAVQAPLLNRRLRQQAPANMGLKDDTAIARLALRMFPSSATARTELFNLGPADPDSLGVSRTATLQITSCAWHLRGAR